MFRKIINLYQISRMLIWFPVDLSRNKFPSKYPIAQKRINETCPRTYIEDSIYLNVLQLKLHPN
jgi:hypothetical protein